jgi:uncharacterized phage infection (PIP) family protein YhgE
MTTQLASRQEKHKKIVKAALCRPRNLFILSTGIITGIAAAPILIPIGVMAYGIVCYLDLNSEAFVKKVLQAEEHPAKPLAEPPPQAVLPKTPPLDAPELQHLQTRIAATQGKIQQIYDQADEFTRGLLGDFAQVENLVGKSAEFFSKAQQIRHYLASENVAQIQQEMSSLQEKIQRGRDEFAKRQYQQALAARRKHLESLRDIGQVYERLVSQLTNIAISLDSMHARMMKLKSSEYSLASAESDQVAAQLNRILADVEQLDAALKENLTLPK